MYREMDMGFWLEKADAELGGVEHDARGATRVHCGHLSLLAAPLAAEAQVTGR